MDLLLLSNSMNHGQAMFSHAAEAFVDVAAGDPVTFVPYALADWDDYAVQMRDTCDGEPLLENTAGNAPGGWTPRPAWRPVTKFERRARYEGREVHDLVFRRL